MIVSDRKPNDAWHDGARWGEMSLYAWFTRRGSQLELRSVCYNTNGFMSHIVSPHELQFCCWVVKLFSPTRRTLINDLLQQSLPDKVTHITIRWQKNDWITDDQVKIWHTLAKVHTTHPLMFSSHLVTRVESYSKMHYSWSYSVNLIAGG